MTDLSDWQRRDQKLWLRGYDDVLVSFLNSGTSDPFQATVGQHYAVFAYLDDAMDWCRQVAHGRDIVLNKEMLPEEPPAPNEDREEAFFAARGLTA